jgi:hypothetical protein
LGGEGVYGTYWNYNDGHYFYCETTGEGWTIGELPSEYSKATVFPIYTGQQYIPKVQVTIPEFPLPTTAIALVAATTTLLAVVAVKKVNKKETG